MLRPTPGDPWGVEQHHWNTGAKENQQLNPGNYLFFRCPQGISKPHSQPFLDVIFPFVVPGRDRSGMDILSFVAIIGGVSWEYL